MSFVPYLLFAFVIPLLMNEWPDRFWARSVFMSAQGVVNLLKLAIGLEIAGRTFQMFPGTWTAARRFCLAILSFTAVTALAPSIAAADPDPYFIAITLVGPRVENGILWLMGLTLLVALWYRVPVHPFHASMLTSFVTYQASSLAIFSLLRYGYDDLREPLGILDNVAYQLAASWWTYAAWRRETPTSVAHVDTLRRLRPMTLLLRTRFSRRIPPISVPSPTRVEAE